MANELTIAELKFCHAYVQNGGRGGEAFAAAFPYSRKVNGYDNSDRLLKKPSIFCKIMELRGELERDHKIDRDRVLDELACVAFRDDISHYLDYEEGTQPVIRDLGELSPRQARAIKSVSVDPKTGTVKLEFEDRLQALRQIAKILGLETTKHESSEVKFVVTVPMKFETSQAWEQAALEMNKAGAFGPQTMIDVTPSKVDAAITDAQAVLPPATSKVALAPAYEPQAHDIRPEEPAKPVPVPRPNPHYRG